MMAAVMGCFYQVPHIWVSPESRSHGWHSDGWIPVLGPKHTDIEHIGFPHEHYHIDWRFVSDRMLAYCITSTYGKPHGSVVTNTHGLAGVGGGVEGDVVTKRRKCQREMPDFPAHPAWGVLETAYACQKLKAGNICPHRGIDLTPFIKPDGTVICPGHGLRWDATTGLPLPHHVASATGGVAVWIAS